MDLGWTYRIANAKNLSNIKQGGDKGGISDLRSEI
jgi:hypothetical protein